MEIVKWVLVFLLAGLVIWLLVDTIVLVVKKKKAREQAKRLKDQEIIDENDNHN